MTAGASPVQTSPLWWRTHAGFLAALALGAVLRVVVSLAYRPALMFPDTFDYVRGARTLVLSPVRPSGYSLFLAPVLGLSDSLAPVAVLQHLLGLALAVACYVFLLRRGMPRWGATLAVLPLLADPLQLVLEHYVLTDVLFETLLVTACLVLLWRRRPGLGAVVVAGALVGAAGTVRGAGSFLVVAFVVALLCLRARWTRLVAFVVAAALPLGGYMVSFHHTYGEYAVASTGPRFLYARLAPVVDCTNAQLELPAYERMLCPRGPVGQRPSTDWYMWGLGQGPAYHVVPPPGMTVPQVLKDFDKRVVRAEPVTYLRAVVKDFAGGFAPNRTYDVPGYPASYWLFADHYWSLDTFIARHTMSKDVLRDVSYRPAPARFLQEYRQWVYTPGPLMGALALVALAAALGLGRARRCGDRVAVGLLLGACLIPLLTGAALSGFSWRYQLPQVALLPVAGALGLAALVRGRPPGQPAPAPALWVPDRSVARAAGLAALAGALVAALVAVAGVASGWFLAGPAAVVGAVAGALVSGTLLVARARAGGAESSVRPTRAGRRT